jgi:hypothetical protein
MKHNSPYQIMKTKRINAGLFAAVALALTQAGNASVMIGWYAFNGSKPLQATDDTAEYIGADPLYSGVSGWVTSPLQATQGSGGSYDGDYGDGPSTSPNQSLPQLPPGDGSATVRKLDAGALSAYSVLTFWVTNTGTSGIPLETLYFDAAEPPPAGNADQLLFARIWENATFDPNASATWWGMGTPLGSDIAVQGETTANDFVGYSRSLAGRTLDAGETIAIMFNGRIADPNNPYDSNTIWIDNVAINAIPEPGSVLGLGFVLASGLMFRNRRKS